MAAVKIIDSGWDLIIQYALNLFNNGGSNFTHEQTFEKVSKVEKKITMESECNTIIWNVNARSNGSDHNVRLWRFRCIVIIKLKLDINTHL